MNAGSTCRNHESDSNVTVLPEKTHCPYAALDTDDLVLSGVTLDNESVFIRSQSLWKECYITITLDTHSVRFAWQRTNGEEGVIIFRLAENTHDAWHRLIDAWQDKWPLCIPGFVRYVSAEECTPAYGSGNEGCFPISEITQDKDAYSWMYRECRGGDSVVTNAATNQTLEDVLLEGERCVVDPPRVYQTGRLKVNEVAAGFEFVLKRGPYEAEETFCLQTLDVGRVEAQEIIESGHTNDIGVIYQDSSSGDSRTSSSQNDQTKLDQTSVIHFVSQDEIPSSIGGGHYLEGSANGKQVFTASQYLFKRVCVYTSLGPHSLDIHIRRTNWKQETLHLCIKDKNLLNALEKVVDDRHGRCPRGHATLVHDVSPERASKSEYWSAKLAVLRSSGTVVDTAVNHGNNEICNIDSCDFIEMVGSSEAFVKADDVYRKVHVELKSGMRATLELLYPDGAVELVYLFNRASQRGDTLESKREREDYIMEVLNCWNSVYPEGMLGMFNSNKASSYPSPIIRGPI